MPTNPDRELLKALFNSFKPDTPLEPGDPRYVEFQEVRGDEDIRTELGGYIINDESNTYQLYSGHRGSGKSTELKRLAKYLEEEGFVVVYFAAATDDAGDLSFQDTQYQDILLSCTRQLLDKLQDVDDKPLREWLKKRWDKLIDLALTEVKLEKLTLDAAIPMFSKITAAVRTEPSKREEIRKLVEADTESLVQALNQFIESARRKGDRAASKIVVIADNLDRIVPIYPEGQSSNLEDIFINRSELMRSLRCHMVYTAPISLLYSKSASDLQDIYGKPQILPMVMVEERDSDELVSEGMKLLREAIERRVGNVTTELALVPQVFESDRVLDLLCFSCGGHLRDLMHMARNAVNLAVELPIKEKQVKRAIANFRPAYMAALNEEEWPLLLEVHGSKRKLNDSEGKYRDLLAKRCILEYRFFDEEEQELVTWYDVHPLIRGAKLFRERWDLHCQENIDES